MAIVHFKELEVQTMRDMPSIGTMAPDFVLVKSNLERVSLSDYSNKRLLLNIFPSIDTSVCAISSRKFYKRVSDSQKGTLMCISRDLPFAHARFCTSEKMDNLLVLSDLGESDFALSYGVLMKNGPLANLLARAVILLDENHKIIYKELVSDISKEPNYDSAMDHLVN